jgi:hypothetical protein
VIALAVLAGLLAIAGYLAACWLAPFGPCWRCGNDPHRRGDCRRCDYTGRRIRTGRRLWTYLRRLYDDAHEPPPRERR